jgi:hypothetical protein
MRRAWSETPGAAFESAAPIRIERAESEGVGKTDALRPPIVTAWPSAPESAEAILDRAVPDFKV